MVATSRVHVRIHHASDVIGGTVIGVCLVTTVMALRFERNRRPHAGWITFAVWVILIAAVLFLTALVEALRNFT